MTISEMHIMFRQYAQRMGMQNVRAIVPEQIDVLLNVAIQDTISNIITKHLTLTSKNEVTTNVKIGQVNGLSTLYKTLIVNGEPQDTTSTSSPFQENKDSNVKSIYTDISKLNNFDYLYLCDVHINYLMNNKLTAYYPINIIEDSTLGNTLTDYILRPKPTNPIATVVNNNIVIYLGTLTEAIKINNVRFSYIEKPAIVHYDDTDSKNNVNCNLPEYLHTTIVKAAVDAYNTIIDDSTTKPKQQNPYSALLQQLINQQSK